MNFASDLVLPSLKKIFIMNFLKFLVAEESITNSLHKYFAMYDKLDILSSFYFRWLLFFLHFGIYKMGFKNII